MATPGKSARNVRATGETALLTSRDNRWLKEFRVALRGGLPTENGFVGVEGVRLVEEALRSGCRIQAVLFGESGERHHERLSSLIDRPEMAFPVLRTTDRLFEGLADTEHPQGVAALVHPRETSFDDFVRAPLSACAPLLVILAGVQDPGNVGTILRTAAAFGATGAATAASGISGTLSILLAQLKVAGVQTLASSVHEPRDGEQPLLAPWEVDWCQPVALLVGNEGAGLPEEVERSTDARIRIPMASGIESLNAAAAAAVVFYEAARQRNSVPSSHNQK